MQPISFSIQELLAPWRQVAIKVDTFFDRAYEKYRSQMACSVGCAGCCQQDLTVTLLEALAVIEGLEALDTQLRTEVALQGQRPGPPCAFLVDGRCSIYDWRPMVCRSHGVPVRLPSNEDDWDDDSTLADDEPEPEIRCCELNFKRGFPQQAVLNSTILAAGVMVADGITRRRLSATSSGDIERFTLRDLAKTGRSALPSDVTSKLLPAATKE
jgi:Fe-S-cluster containining protein